MKILLISVNASFSHSSLAVRSLKVFADQFLSEKENSSLKEKAQIQIEEFTINQPILEVLRKIAFSQADLVLFSTYIWNAEFVSKLIPEVKKLLPKSLIGAGGPEFSYAAQKYLSQFSSLDFVIFGEGEIVFTDLIKNFCDFDFSSFSEEDFIQKIKKINSVYFKNQGKIEFTKTQPLIENLDLLPFAYPEIIEKKYSSLDHKILYYESSRGCPFSCSYCLSSVDKSVRFKSLDKVFKELQYFLDGNFPLVKFVDRTYNLKSERYIEIWHYILNHHNKKTMFHFEIEAEFLSDEALDFLQNVPAGIMQFEMGVQSSNPKTLKSVNRSENTKTLAEKILRIPRTIHQHLDLIAGLPYENLESFGRSYDFVMSLKPDALQLGFLKVLGGTQMEFYAKENGWKWMQTPVYECLSTPYLSFEDLDFLKRIEILTDAYWNKDLFGKTVSYIFKVLSPWKFLSELCNFATKKGAFLQARKDLWYFNLLFEFFVEIEKTNTFTELNFLLLKDLLRYDFVKTGKKGAFPDWYEHFYDKEKHRILLEKNDMLGNSRIGFAFSEFEQFSFDVESENPEDHPGHFEKLIKYS